MSALRIGELFAGYGGLGMGVQRAIGGEIAWYSDVCKFDKNGNAGHYEPHHAPCSILAHRLPSVPNHGDITKIDWSTVEPVDVLTGGSPCQDLSHAGKRSGMTEGTRSNLWVAMREAIAQLRPGLVVWENVRGAYSAEADSALEFCAGCMGDAWYRGAALRALGRVLGDLSDLGYVGGWHGLRAADVGAPHGRFRVFVTAVPADQRHEWGWSARDRWAGPADCDRRSLTLLPTPAVNDMGEGKTVEAWDEWTAKMQAAHGNGNGHGKSLAIEAQRTAGLGCADCGHSWNEHRTFGEGATDYFCRFYVGTYERCHCTSRPSDQQWGIYADAIARWEALTRPAPAPTQPSKKGTPQLSAAFSEWLMGLPAGWVTDVPGITRNEALKALGNGVVPQQAEAALRFLLGAQVVAAA